MNNVQIARKAGRENDPLPVYSPVTLPENGYRVLAVNQIQRQPGVSPAAR